MRTSNQDGAKFHSGVSLVSLYPSDARSCGSENFVRWFQVASMGLRQDLFTSEHDFYQHSAVVFLSSHISISLYSYVSVFPYSYISIFLHLHMAVFVYCSFPMLLYFYISVFPQFIFSNSSALIFSHFCVPTKPSFHKRSHMRTRHRPRYAKSNVIMASDVSSDKASFLWHTFWVILPPTCSVTCYPTSITFPLHQFSKNEITCTLKIRLRVLYWINQTRGSYFEFLLKKY